MNINDLPHVNWKYVGDKKIPVNGRGHEIDITDSTNWLSARAAKLKANGKLGVGVVLGRIGGVDLDDCIKDGRIDKWAKGVMRLFAGAYMEKSPSGNGLKIYAGGAPELTKHKVTIAGGQIEAYAHDRYFCFTGDKLEGDCENIPDLPLSWVVLSSLLQRDVADAWAGSKKVGSDKSRSGMDFNLVRLLRSAELGDDAITLALKCYPFGQVSGMIRGRSRQIDRLLKNVVPYVTDSRGGIIADNQANVRLAIDKMGWKLTYNEFTDQVLCDGRTIDDMTLERMWLRVDTECKFRPSLQFFRIVMYEYASRKSFHPVRQYLDSLKWDKRNRIDDWLVEYAGAADNKYVRAVGRLMLLAAVRRVREPGCKFDEMVVLESGQGTNKTSALEILAGEDWYSDDLPLNSRTKEVIEQTRGRWIIEASELAGMRKSDIEHLKAFISRRYDRARLAYDRSVTERGRHFVVVGTTNSSEYLRDVSGNRRYWPVRIDRFELDDLRRDRDMLWAEAAAVEAEGVSIRMTADMWEQAAQEQEKRREADAWEDVINAKLRGRIGRIRCSDMFPVVGVTETARRDYTTNRRLGDCMRALGWNRCQLRDGEGIGWFYVKGTRAERRTLLVEVDGNIVNARVNIKV